MIIFDLLVSVAPIAGYYSQIKLIKQKKSLGTFSIDVCAILMISGILRIYFWFMEGYAVNLLFQAILVIAIQVWLLKLCVDFSPRPKALKKQQTFWRWNSFDQYIKFLFGLTAVVTVITVITQLLSLPLIGSLTGFISMAIQSTLGMPQMFSNIRTKSVKGLSLFLIFNWFVGDLFKTIYFIIENQPMQFIMCGSIQLTVDIVILAQILMYSQRKSNKNQAYETIGQDQKN